MLPQQLLPGYRYTSSDGHIDITKFENGVLYGNYSFVKGCTLKYINGKWYRKTTHGKRHSSYPSLEVAKCIGTIEEVEQDD